MDETAEVAAVEEQRGGEPIPSSQSLQTPPQASAVSERQAPTAESKQTVTRRPSPPGDSNAPALTSSGQTVATTVKLDENRYLRLADAGKPGPGRLKRRTIQEMVIEALDEWFERRGI
jgi:hypothetical protein